MEKLIDIYTDYEIVTFERVEMTKLSKVIGDKSHDVFTKMLSEYIDTESSLIKRVRGVVSRLKQEHGEGMIIIDDTVVKKPHTKENELISKHYDNSEKSIVKGINLLNFIYTPVGDSSDMRVPVAFEPIVKDIVYEDNYKEKRKSSITKNEMVRDKLNYLAKSSVEFEYVVGDSWFASSENIDYIDQKLQKRFVFKLKSNRSIALSKEDKINGKYTKIKELDMNVSVDCLVYLKGCSTPCRITGKKQQIG